MSFAGWIEHHRRSLLFVAFALALAGLLPAITLPVGLFPVDQLSAHPHRGRDRQHAGPADADRSDRAARGGGARGAGRDRRRLDDFARLRREIFVDFPWGSDMNQALLGVDAAFAQTLPELPPGTQLRSDPDEPERDHAVRLVCADFEDGIRRRSCAAWRNIRSCRC